MEGDECPTLPDAVAFLLGSAMGVNMRHFATSTAALLAVSGLAGMSLAPTSVRASPNLLTNGSFEDTANFYPNSGNDTMILCSSSCGYSPGSSTSMTGWTVIGAAGSELAWIGPTNPYSGSASYASNGSYFLDLTGYNNGAPYGGVTQAIASKAGNKYQLSFDLGDDQAYNGGYTADAITASAGSTSQTFFSSADPSTDDWATQTLNFTATSASTVISLIGDQGWAYIGLDNVSVTLTSGSNAVPEPGTLALLGVSLAGLVGFARRRVAPRASISHR
jgi:PEP-CTERM motif/Protein of unknown function (DUF642)